MLDSLTFDWRLVAGLAALGLGTIFLGALKVQAEKRQGSATAGMGCSMLLIVAGIGVLAWYGFGIYQGTGLDVGGSASAPSSTPDPNATPTLVPLPLLQPGWRMSDYPDYGFTVGLPDSWAELDMQAASWDEAIDPLVGYYSDTESLLTFGDNIEEARHDGIVFYAVQTEPIGAFPGYLNLVVLFMKPFDAELELDDARVFYDDMLETLGEEWQQARVDLPIGPADTFSMSDLIGEYTFEGTFYIFVWGKTVCAAFTSNLGAEGAEAASDEIMQTFRWTVQPSEPLPGLNYEECLPDAAFISDVTVPDGTDFTPGESFDKVWLVESTGCLPWPDGTRLVFDEGDIMGGPDGIDVSTSFIETETELTVSLIAPDTPGTYQGYWQLETPDGTRFGDRLFVMIVVQ